ncbi:MAG: hypothetical protein BAA04_05795 [Firmicutes bacterium ZCTH02-B6]|nr:MAG: hypothetical protein BAA04_05795 [Firmicutes bacterium ZCTH02-B6]
MTSPLPTPLPEPFVRFIDLFNAGAYWESHEVLEQPWRANRSDFYQGLIIYASAFVHAQRGNPRGVRLQLLKVQRKLPPYRPHYLGIDVDRIFAHADWILKLLDDDPSLSGPALRSRLPFPRLALQPELVRGDEPELRGIA